MEPAILFKPLDPVQRSLAMRRRSPSIELPRPEALSGVPVVLPHDTAALRQWGRDTAGLPVVWDVWRRRLACFVAQWNAPGEPEADALANAHDRRLGIARSRAAPTLALLHGVVVSLDRFCQECTGAREFKEHAVIPAALIEIWQLLLQDTDPVRPLVGGRLVDVHGRAPDASRRWAIGHQLLATLTQGQIVSLLAYERLQPAPSIEQTRAFLQRTTRLCQAGAAACRFTADLAHSTRSQPQQRFPAKGLEPSDTQDNRSMDHRHLIEVVTRLRPWLARARAVCPQEHAAMTEAISRFCTEHHQLLGGRSGAQKPLQSVRLQPALQPARPEPERPVERQPQSQLKPALPRLAAGTAPAAQPPARPVAKASLTGLLSRWAGVHLYAQP